MNAATKTLFTALIAVAGAAAIGMGLADHLAAADAPQVHKLERVVVVGKRATEAGQQIAKLPRVVIEGRSASTLVAAAAPRCSTAVC
ncbi:hypothetical protein [Pelomonas sp. SE-A7]|uniref:hypothetical protein n=1 Tax=Pelomonas sp. SE-A7 TaxID=3054953 RepID=UPI00259C8280|nr:hypothetical protein [Pelomonas sp. SE-A7]MDM4767038.1 hypothetical protein [Pelomonas sp. SE-A7]